MTLAGTTAYLWDTWGNVTKVGSSDYYYWDDADRLTKYDGSGTTNDTSYVYAAGSWKRVKRTISGSTMYFGWDGANLAAEYLSDGTVSQRFLTVGIDDELSTTNGDGTKYYLHDGLGSVRTLVDSSETVRNIYDTRAFGQDQGTQTSGVTNPFRYTGAYDDSWESAQGPVYYLRHRYYMPGVGLFASRDTIWADGYRGWGYVYNSPLMLADPMGRGTYLEDVGNVFLGYYDAGAGMVLGTFHMVAHPIDTAKGIGMAAAHPILAGQAIGAGVAADWNSGYRGQGKVVGDALLLIGGALAPLAEGATVSKAAASVGAAGVGEEAAGVGAAGVGEAAAGGAELTCECACAGTGDALARLARPAWANTGGGLVNWMRQLEASKGTLTRAQAEAIAKEAERLGVKCRIDEGHPGTDWPGSHLNIGPKKSGPHVGIED